MPRQDGCSKALRSLDISTCLVVILVAFPAQSVLGAFNVKVHGHARLALDLSIVRHATVARLPANHVDHMVIWQAVLEGVRLILAV